jgi:hypothetical protein
MYLIHMYEYVYHYLAKIFWTYFSLDHNTTPRLFVEIQRDAIVNLKFSGNRHRFFKVCVMFHYFPS